MLNQEVWKRDPETSIYSTNIKLYLTDGVVSSPETERLKATGKSIAVTVIDEQLADIRAELIKGLE